MTDKKFEKYYMDTIQSTTSIKRASRHVWKHECGQTYTRNVINQLKELEQGVKVCAKCKITFNFEKTTKINTEPKKLKLKKRPKKVEKTTRENKPSLSREKIIEEAYKRQIKHKGLEKEQKL